MRSGFSVQADVFCRNARGLELHQVPSREPCGEKNRSKPRDKAQPGHAMPATRAGLEGQWQLFRFTECAKQSQSLSALFELLVKCATEEGFTQVAYGAAHLY